MVGCSAHPRLNAAWLNAWLDAWLDAPPTHQVDPLVDVGQREVADVAVPGAPVTQDGAGASATGNEVAVGEDDACVHMRPRTQAPSIMHGKAWAREDVAYES